MKSHALFYFCVLLSLRRNSLAQLSVALNGASNEPGYEVATVESLNITVNSTGNQNSTDKFVVLTSPVELQGLVWKRGPTVVEVLVKDWPENVTLVSLTASVSRTSIATVEGDAEISLSDLKRSSDEFLNFTLENQADNNKTSLNVKKFLLQPHDLGRAVFNLTISYMEDGLDTSGVKHEVVKTLPISVVKEVRLIDQIFKITIYILVITATLGMGANIDIGTVRETLKKPKAPIIALVSQFTVMPLLSFAIIHLEGYVGGAALGFFCMGCAPGGGSSNTYTHLLGGNMTVSITMTLLSTVLSIAMIPFWLYTLGRALPSSGGERIIVPFLSIVQSLALIIIPLAIGLAIKIKLPRVAKVIRKVLKVYLLLMALFMLTFGVYTNLYIFQMFNPRLVFTAAMLPYGGFLLGGLLALIFRCDWTMIKTIAIETGLQNTSVPFIVVATFLKSPDFELAAIPIVAAAVMSPLPLFVATIFYTIYNKCIKKKTAESVNAEGSKEISGEEMQDIEKVGDPMELKEREANGNFETGEAVTVPPKYDDNVQDIQEAQNLLKN